MTTPYLQFEFGSKSENNASNYILHEFTQNALLFGTSKDEMLIILSHDISSVLGQDSNSHMVVIDITRRDNFDIIYNLKSNELINELKVLLIPGPQRNGHV